VMTSGGTVGMRRLLVVETGNHHMPTTNAEQHQWAVSEEI
jgi:hypothetical protein